MLFYIPCSKHWKIYVCLKNGSLLILIYMYIQALVLTRNGRPVDMKTGRVGRRTWIKNDLHRFLCAHYNV